MELTKSVVCRQLNFTGNPFVTFAKPVNETNLDPLIEINECKKDEASIMDCDHSGFGIATPDCDRRIFVDCDTSVQPPPIIATRVVGNSTFGIVGVRLKASKCDYFSSMYGGRAAILDTEDKYDTVYKMIQTTNKELGITKNSYRIGLENGPREGRGWRWGNPYSGKRIDDDLTASRWATGEPDGKVSPMIRGTLNG
jgi:hypothetical protein